MQYYPSEAAALPTQKCHSAIGKNESWDKLLPSKTANGPGDPGGAGSARRGWRGRTREGNPAEFAAIFPESVLNSGPLLDGKVTYHRAEDVAAGEKSD